MKAALQNFHARMQRALDHIDRHRDEELDLDALSSVTAYSKYHFHRQFTATFGLSVHRYVQLARMKRASRRLAYVDAQSVTDIGMDAGYEALDAFARAFRQRFGQAPNGEPIKAGETPAGAARCSAASATPTTWSPPGSTFIATGCRPAARKHANFPIYCHT